MSDEGEQIAEARRRDECAVQALGDYTPLEEMLHTADERALLWYDTINFLEVVGRVGADNLAREARALLERVRAL